MPEYRGWIYMYEKQPTTYRGQDWRAWPATASADPRILAAATESDIRKEIRQARDPQ